MTCCVRFLAGMTSILLTYSSAVPRDQEEPRSEETLTLITGETYTGRCEKVDSNKILSFKTKGLVRTFLIEDVRELVLKKMVEEAPIAGSYPQIRLASGQVLHVTSPTLAGRTLETEGESIGRLSIRTDRLRQIVFSRPEDFPALQPVPPGKVDLMVNKEVRRGELLKFDSEKLTWVVDSKTQELPMSSVQAIFFPQPKAVRFPTGWYVQVRMAHGEELNGAVLEMSDRVVGFYSHELGQIRIPRDSVAQLKFSPRLSAWQGYLLLGGQNYLAEIDTHTGEVLWSHTNVSFPSTVEKLPNGNVLVADQSAGRVVEMNTKGEVVWEKGDLQTPMSAQCLENGNIFIATYLGEMMELKREDKSVVWEKRTGSYRPSYVQKLANNHVLVTSMEHVRVFELDENGKEVWYLDRNVGRPFRAKRLENGNTLIIDNSFHKIVEVAPDRSIKMTINNVISASDAVRLPSGNTLTLHTASGGQKTIVEYDPQGKPVREIKVTGAPYAMYAY